MRPMEDLREVRWPLSLPHDQYTELLVSDWLVLGGVPGAVPWHFHSPGRSARRHLLFAEDTADQWRGLLRPLVRQSYPSGARAGAIRRASPFRRRAIMNESHVMNGGAGPQRISDEPVGPGSS